MTDQTRDLFEFFKRERQFAYFDKGLTVLGIDHENMDIYDLNIYAAKLENVHETAERMGPYRSIFEDSYNKKCDALEAYINIKRAEEESKMPLRNDVSEVTEYGIIFN